MIDKDLSEKEVLARVNNLEICIYGWTHQITNPDKDLTDDEFIIKKTRQIKEWEVELNEYKEEYAELFI